MNLAEGAARSKVQRLIFSRFTSVIDKGLLFAKARVGKHLPA
jgi:hypothetical protein